MKKPNPIATGVFACALLAMLNTPARALSTVETNLDNDLDYVVRELGTFGRNRANTKMESVVKKLKSMADRAAKIPRIRRTWPPALLEMRRAVIWLQSIWGVQRSMSSHKSKLESCKPAYGKMKSAIALMVKRSNPKGFTQIVKLMAEYDWLDVRLAEMSMQQSTVSQGHTSILAYRDPASGIWRIAKFRAAGTALRAAAKSAKTIVSEQLKRYIANCKPVAEIEHSKLVKRSLKRLARSASKRYKARVDSFVAFAKKVYALDCMNMRKIQTAACGVDFEPRTREDTSKLKSIAQKAGNETEREVVKLAKQFKVLRKEGDVLKKYKRVQNAAKKQLRRLTNELVKLKRLNAGAGLGDKHPLLKRIEAGAEKSHVTLLKGRKCVWNLEFPVAGNTIDCVDAEKCTVYEFVPAVGGKTRSDGWRRAGAGANALNRYLSNRIRAGRTPDHKLGGQRIMCGMAKNGKCWDGQRSHFRAQLIEYAHCTNKAGAYKCIK